MRYLARRRRFEPMNAAQRLLQSHRALALFLTKMVAAYAVWFVAYDLWLLPDGRLDAALSAFVASVTGGLLSVFSDAAAVDGRTVWLQGHGISIVNGCNGLSALSLFVGFVVAYPGAWARRALFIPLGIAVLVLANVLRCVSLLIVLIHRPDIFDAVHFGHAMLVFYAVIFGLWVLWANVGERPLDPGPALA